MKRSEKFKHERKMDYKQKYNEALERAGKAFETCNVAGMKTALWEIFPELKESEDEKIRKELIMDIDVAMPIETAQRYIAWLEKQGEQKPTRPVWKYKKDHTPLLRDSFILNKYGCVSKSPSGAIVSDVWILDFDELAKLPKEEFEKQGEQKPYNNVKPKFKVGDWIINNDKRIAVPIQILKIEDYGYVTSIGYTSFDKVKTDHHLWTIQDAKDGDVLSFGGKTVVIFKDLYNATTFHSYCHMEDGTFGVSKDGMPDWWNGKGFHPATKEQHDLLFSKMKEAGYEWDAEKKELKKIEKNSAWSEEDERMMFNVLECFKNGWKKLPSDILMYGDWLRSLKERMKGE